MDEKILMICLLIILGIVVVICIFQRNKFPLFALAKEYLPLIIEVIGLLLAGLATLALHSSDKENTEEENDPYQDPKGSMNYRGDYCDKYKSTWYF